MIEFIFSTLLWSFRFSLLKNYMFILMRVLEIYLYFIPRLKFRSKKQILLVWKLEKYSLLICFSLFLGVRSLRHTFNVYNRLFISALKNQKKPRTRVLCNCYSEKFHKKTPAKKDYLTGILLWVLRNFAF